MKWLIAEFEKWRAIRARVGGVLAWVACLCVWHASVSGVVASVSCLRR